MKDMRQGEKKRKHEKAFFVAIHPDGLGPRPLS